MPTKETPEVLYYQRIGDEYRPLGTITDISIVEGKDPTDNLEIKCHNTGEGVNCSVELDFDSLKRNKKALRMLAKILNMSVTDLKFPKKRKRSRKRRRKQFIKNCTFSYAEE